MVSGISGIVGKIMLDRTMWRSEIRVFTRADWSILTSDRQVENVREGLCAAVD